MKILVTGSSGFIGKNLISHLSKKKSLIIAASHVKQKKKNKNIINLKLNKANLNKLNNIDVVIHCAASTPPKYSQTECFENNKVLDDMILSFIKKKKIEKVIYLSSMSVYGKIKNKVVNEKDTLKNLDLYGKSKLRSERKLYLYSKKKFSSILVLRLCSIVGNGSHSNFISNFKKNFSNNKKIYITNKKKLFNACLHMNDLSKFISNILTNFKLNFDIINIASDKPVKLDKIVNLFKKKYPKKKIEYLKTKSPTYVVNIDKAKKNYGLKKIETEKTIKKYLSLN